ncbi:MAG: hypothetical protein LRZ99_01145 [Desulfotomaculum sp.]|nr:hypothetical protein [Desulfotomaculum sp.]MCL0081153.1 hypothetical protein [Peptococcaceae bacterium]
MLNNISTRELVDLQEHLQLEGTNITNFNHFTHECHDQQLKTLCQELTNRRVHSFQMISGYLSKTNFQ